MAGAFITVDIKGDTEFIAYLDRIIARSGSAKPAFEIAGQIIAASVRKNFLEEGRPSTWAPLSTSTKFSIIGGSKGLKKSGRVDGKTQWTLKRSARRKLADRKILINRGMAGGLMGSIHPTPSSTNVRVGTYKVYGAVHHFGINKIVGAKRHVKTVFGTRGSAITPYKMHMKIPARPYLLIQDEDWTAIKAAFERYLTEE